MAGNGRLDDEVGEEAELGYGEARDGGGGVVSQPLLHGLQVCTYSLALHLPVAKPSAPPRCLHGRDLVQV